MEPQTSPQTRESPLPKKRTSKRKFVIVLETMRIRLTRPGATVPKQATQGSAGYDLTAVLDAPVTVAHGQVTTIPTGVAIELASGYAALVLGRSGLGIRHGVVPANGVGLIDSDYRGELLVGLTCQKNEGYTIQPGERIAQMVVVPVCTPQLEIVDSLEDTQRDAGGFGSTGK